MTKSRVYVDTNVWIANYKPEQFTPEQKRGFDALLESVERGEVIVVGSYLLACQLISKSYGVLEEICDGRKGALVPVDNTVAERTHKLQNHLRIKTGLVLSGEDAIHLATAACSGCQTFVTLDRNRKDKQLAPLQDKEEIEKHLHLQVVDPSHFIPPEPEQPALELEGEPK